MKKLLFLCNSSHQCTCSVKRTGQRGVNTSVFHWDACSYTFYQAQSYLNGIVLTFLMQELTSRLIRWFALISTWGQLGVNTSVFHWVACSYTFYEAQSYYKGIVLTFLMQELTSILIRWFAPISTWAQQGVNTSEFHWVACSYTFYEAQTYYKSIVLTFLLQELTSRLIRWFAFIST